RSAAAGRDEVRAVFGCVAAGSLGGVAGWPVMNLSPGFLVVALGVLGLGVWVLHKIGRALASVVEALAAMVIVFVALWWACKAALWLLTQVVTRWRTSLTVVAVYLWCVWIGWVWLVVNLGGLALLLGVWRLVDVMSFDQWCGRLL